MVDLTVTDPGTTADDLRVLVPDADRALARVEVAPTAAIDAGDAIERALRDGLGRVPRIDWQSAPATDDPVVPSIASRADLRATVLDYLDRRLPADDPHRDEVLRLAEGFLDQETRS